MVGIFDLDKMKEQNREIERIRERYKKGTVPHYVAVSQLVRQFGYGAGDAATILDMPRGGDGDTGDR